MTVSHLFMHRSRGPFGFRCAFCDKRQEDATPGEACPAQPLHPDNPTPDNVPVHTEADRSANDSATHDPRDYVG